MTWKEFRERFKIKLNEEQEDAVRSADDSQVLLLACPGSGKTSSLIARIGYMIYCLGADPKNILAITFTKASANDMTERYQQFFGRVPDGLRFQTIHSFCYRALRDLAQTNPQAMPNVESHTWSIVVDAYRKAYDEYPSETDVKDVTTQICYAKNMMLSNNELHQITVGKKPFKPVFDAYNKLLRKEGKMDFDDLLVRCLFEIKENPLMKEYMKSVAKHILLDEAQDTSKLQHEIISVLSESASSLFMVGDEDQSIYGFRAAFPDAMLNFKTRYPKATVFKLPRNYRSAKLIIRASNDLISNNKKRYDKKMRATRAAKGEVRFINVHKREAQSTYLLPILRASDRETAVLYRNNDCAIPLIYTLMENGVPYTCRDIDTSFFDKKDVASLRLLWKFIQHPFDEELFMSLYYRFGLIVSKEEAKAAIAGKRLKDDSLVDSLYRVKRGSSGVAKNVEGIRIDIETVKRSSAKSGVKRMAEKILSLGNDKSKRIELLQSIARADEPVEEFFNKLDRLEKVIKYGSFDPKAKVVLSTIHGSKGLEFDRVFIMDAILGVFPLTADGDLEEERRLMYVAMTRAKNELGILMCDEEELSPFLSEINEELRRDHKVQSDPAYVQKDKVIINAPVADVPKKKVRLSQLNDANNVPLSAEEMQAGTKVRHKKEGLGEIISRDDKFVEIRFETGTTKKYSIEVCVNNGFLTKVC